MLVYLRNPLNLKLIYLSEVLSHSVILHSYILHINSLMDFLEDIAQCHLQIPVVLLSRFNLIYVSVTTPNTDTINAI